MRAGLAEHSDSSTLLRLVTILHIRSAGVEHLVFDAGRATVRATVTLASGTPASLQQMLLRPADVTEVTVCSEEEAPGSR
ncbi:hypothetical protein AB0H42_25980 [Nocardia sp. NPDC050799]|uniref:hypothetical protein n=1 Tax=Nocardia sp. NPDC050799 TaxID=3154842 RepID=UPI00340147CC